MSLLTNGDFSDGLNGWTVSGAGQTAPTHDPVNERVIFGAGNNDVQDGDRLEQAVSLNAGQEYTLTFSASDLGNANAGFGLNVELIDQTGGNTQFLQFVQVANDSTTEVDITFVANFDDALLRIRGGFGFGGVNSTLILDDFALTCFVEGTLIATPNGLREVQVLQQGDAVFTDEGDAPLLYRATRHVSPKELNTRPNWRPIRIRAGSLGAGCPTQDLLVSPAHRMLVSGYGLEVTTGLERGLVSAAALARVMDSITPEPPEHWPDGVTYHHLIFADHKILRANGTLTESFDPSAKAVSRLDREARDEFYALFKPKGNPVLAAPLLKEHELRAVVAK